MKDSISTTQTALHIALMTNERAHVLYSYLRMWVVSSLLDIYSATILYWQ